MGHKPIHKNVVNPANPFLRKSKPLSSSKKLPKSPLISPAPPPTVPPVRTIIIKVPPDSPLLPEHARLNAAKPGHSKKLAQNPIGQNQISSVPFKASPVEGTHSALQTLPQRFPSPTSTPFISKPTPQSFSDIFATTVPSISSNFNPDFESQPHGQRPKIVLGTNFIQQNNQVKQLSSSHSVRQQQKVQQQQQIPKVAAAPSVVTHFRPSSLSSPQPVKAKPAFKTNPSNVEVFNSLFSSFLSPSPAKLQLGRQRQVIVDGFPAGLPDGTPEGVKIALASAANRKLSVVYEYSRNG